MFVDDFYDWIERISKHWSRKQIIAVIKEINRAKRLLEDRLNGRVS
jgi:hypothetical protein